MPIFTATTIALAGLAVAGYSAYQQHQSSQDAAEATQQVVAAQVEGNTSAAGAQRERAELEQRRADIANARSLRGAIRQARVNKAVVMNVGANAGTSASSGVLGGAGSVESQGRSNAGFFNQMTDLNEQVLATQRTESDARVRAGLAQGNVYESEASARQWGTFANLGGTIFTGAGGFKTIFDAAK